jgi:hypothetical protein
LRSGRWFDEWQLACSPAGFAGLGTPSLVVASKTQQHLGIFALFATLRFDPKIEFMNERYPVNMTKSRYIDLTIIRLKTWPVATTERTACSHVTDYVG